MPSKRFIESFSLLIRVSATQRQSRKALSNFSKQLLAIFNTINIPGPTPFLSDSRIHQMLIYVPKSEKQMSVLVISEQNQITPEATVMQKVLQTDSSNQEWMDKLTNLPADW